MNVVWQQDSPTPSRAEDFATISQWWSNLNGKEITWRQRLIPEIGSVADLDWEPKRFDETFQIITPNVRGITLYWRKPDFQDERSTTPYKLELDPLQQQLFIYPQSQRGVVIRVALPQVVYQQVKIKQPQLGVTQTGGQALLTIRDEAQRLEVQVSLSPEKLAELKQQLG
ncbi:MAG: hypothetical protein EDM05_68560 [Leptolyngbya sp. IPPAS B-1204]|uniref:Uncharacterized protein n=1 Tax=Leptolyngbya sp. NK1-12 TaxID=2547451 RepID=A0AA96WDS4_9CYAN|nr:hypothetical protein [Leptolyngbya sp. NK1-12]MBF2047041.1 hypothetical protein [Elainella sp. C42_A2020_010]RNJ70463.1 MAG: hypothetical protein EDM05_04890 [Leptolyngbya sp. IPPAS B-1204]WNZ23423.1 hypothetical protein HJG54_11540 [Leptolyngbya sp. NK1-12]